MKKFWHSAKDVLLAVIGGWAAILLFWGIGYGFERLQISYGFWGFVLSWAVVIVFYQIVKRWPSKH